MVQILALLRLWRRLAAAALVQPLAWELPHAMGVALKRPKKKKNTLNVSRSTIITLCVIGVHQEVSVLQLPCNAAG